MKPGIVCVDDERIILNGLKTQLRNSLGSEVCDNPSEGFDILDECTEDQEPIQIVISDWRMPEMKGDVFLQKVHRKYPSVITLLLTGQADQHSVNNTQKNTGLYAMIPKPWNATQIAQLIKQSLNR